MALECNYKAYDMDNDEDLKLALEFDEKPVRRIILILEPCSFRYLGKSKIKQLQIEAYPKSTKGCEYPELQWSDEKRH